MEATPGFEPGDKGFADLCLTTWLCRLMNQPRLPLCAPNNKYDLYIICDTNRILTKIGYDNAYPFWSGLRGSNPPPSPWQGDALPNELNPRMWCLRSESNQRHGDFQSPALPTELQRHTARAAPWNMATRMGLEPTTSSVTG